MGGQLPKGIIPPAFFRNVHAGQVQIPHRLRFRVIDLPSPATYTIRVRFEIRLRIRCSDTFKTGASRAAVAALSRIWAGTATTVGALTL